MVNILPEEAGEAKKGREKPCGDHNLMLCLWWSLVLPLWLLLEDLAFEGGGAEAVIDRRHFF
jgi:hypothetical protein